VPTVTREMQELANIFLQQLAYNTSHKQGVTKLLKQTT